MYLFKQMYASSSTILNLEQPQTVLTLHCYLYHTIYVLPIYTVPFSIFLKMEKRLRVIPSSIQSVHYTNTHTCIGLRQLVVFREGEHTHTHTGSQPTLNVAKKSKRCAVGHILTTLFSKCAVRISDYHYGTYNICIIHLCRFNKTTHVTHLSRFCCENDPRCNASQLASQLLPCFDYNPLLTLAECPRDVNRYTAPCCPVPARDGEPESPPSKQRVPATELQQETKRRHQVHSGQLHGDHQNSEGALSG